MYSTLHRGRQFTSVFIVSSSFLKGTGDFETVKKEGEPEKNLG